MNKQRVLLLSTTAIGVGLAIAVTSPNSPLPGIFLTAPAHAQNPCAASNPCAAANPCSASAAANHSTKCDVPRLVKEAKTNPCAAKNPCAPKNPCAASNPCGAGANPCGAAAAATITDAEAKRAGECMQDELKAAYAKSALPAAKMFATWPRYSSQAYQSATHGERYVQNYGSDKAKAYSKYEEAGVMPTGAVLAKSSFSVAPDGRISAGPLFVMEKMSAGFHTESGDWKYSMVMSDGALFGETKGKNSGAMQFCIDCHQSASDYDHLMFLPEEYRIKR